MQTPNRMHAGLVAVSLALAVVLLVLGHHQVLTQSLANEKRPLVEVSVDGSKYTVPVYEDVQMSEARKRLDRKAIEDLVGLLNEFITAVFVEQRRTFTVARIMLNMRTVSRRTRAALWELEKTDTSPLLANGYGKRVSDLIYRILASKSTNLMLSDKESARRSFNLLQAIKKISAQSPTGLYLDWDLLTVDGEIFERHAAPLINWAKNHGYGLMLKGFNRLAVFAETLSN